MKILDGLGAETIGRGDSTTGDSIQAELTCEQFRKVIYDSILGDYVPTPMRGHGHSNRGFYRLADAGTRPDAAQWDGWSGRASREAQGTQRRVP